MSEQFVDGYVPIYATFPAEVAGAAMLLHTSGHVALLEARTGRLIRALPFGDRAGSRLHPSGHIYYTAGNDLRRERVHGGDVELVRRFDSPITVGRGEGDFDRTFRYLPIVRGENVGILNVVSGQYVEAHAGPAIDWAQVGTGGDVLAVGLNFPERIIAFGRVGSKLERGRQLAPSLGHSDAATIAGRPHLVTTTSNWPEGAPGRPGEWLVAIDMQTGDVTPIVETGWRAQHIACSLGWACLSFYSEGIPPRFPAGEIWVGKLDGTHGEVVAVAEGAAAEPYIAQPHAAWSADGRRIYYGERGGTRVVDVSALTGGDGPVEPPPPPPPPPPPKPRPRRSCWDRIRGILR